MEYIAPLLFMAFLCGVLGYCVGRDGFTEKMYWRHCEFKGLPPSDYESWNEFLMSKVKTDVKIEAL